MCLAINYLACLFLAEASTDKNVVIIGTSFIGNLSLGAKYNIIVSHFLTNFMKSLTNENSL